MVILIVERARPSLRGELTRWMIEPRAGVFVGNVSATVRDKLWEKVVKASPSGGAMLIHNARTEQGFATRIHGDTSRKLVDFEGLCLVQLILPTRVGVNRSMKWKSSASCHSPHTRGGEPNLVSAKFRQQDCPCRQQDCPALWHLFDSPSPATPHYPCTTTAILTTIVAPATHVHSTRVSLISLIATPCIPAQKYIFRRLQNRLTYDAGRYILYGVGRVMQPNTRDPRGEGTVANPRLPAVTADYPAGLRGGRHEMYTITLNGLEIITDRGGSVATGRAIIVSTRETANEACVIARNLAYTSAHTTMNAAFGELCLPTSVIVTSDTAIIAKLVYTMFRPTLSELDVPVARTCVQRSFQSLVNEKLTAYEWMDELRAVDLQNNHHAVIVVEQPIGE